jgi:hypothetical protein
MNFAGQPITQESMRELVRDELSHDDRVMANAVIIATIDQLRERVAFLEQHMKGLERRMEGMECMCGRGACRQ